MGILVGVNNAIACTTLIIKDNQGAIYQGRTLEFGNNISFYVSYFPTSTRFLSKAPENKVGMEYIAKYSFIGITLKIKNPNEAVVTDGINSSGLTFTQNALTETELPKISDQQNVLDATDLGSWILSQFSTVDEVKTAMNGLGIWQSPAIFSNGKYPFHIAVFDRSGKGIVIEYINGKQIISDNPIGVLTNGPAFNWHLTNLNNYAALVNTKANSSADINGYHIHSVDVGASLLGLPVDDMSPARFIRAAFYTNCAQKPSGENAIAVLGKIMNKFDRIRGVASDKKIDGGFGSNFPKELMSNEPTIAKQETNNGGDDEWVLWTTLRDLNRNLYYIRPENSLNYYKFDLNSISKKSQRFSFPVSDLPNEYTDLSKSDLP